MNQQQTWTASSRKKTGEKMSLLALLFFMMGAVNVYGYLQGSDNQVTSSTTTDGSRLLKVVILAMVVAGMIEFVVN
ncbi:hypothetical protein [Crocosphaera sp. XPORK-15E]|uniref:hypothetical protein n=1 Tax=Crocosphaera sp. XPORK-15E TaxID=3110247 RepID=UPI002B1F427D|nr:hypothetical protein [Crocosphaera sp. XPORK-15E]MEA5535969.1 hypothetical protein [Crocosphaera sp. XPORK-15E]